MNNLETIIDAKVNDFCLDAKNGVRNYDYACGYLKAWGTLGVLMFEKNLEYRRKLRAASGDNMIIRVNAEPYDEYEELDIPVRDIYVVNKNTIWLNDTMLRYDEPTDELLGRIEKYVPMYKFKCMNDGITYDVWINMNYVRSFDEGENGTCKLLVGKWCFGGKFDLPAE